MKNNYEVRGDVTAIYMKCPNGVILETLIETSDLELLKDFQYTWFPKLTRDKWYAESFIRVSTGKRKRLSLHRKLMGSPEGFQIDHINHNTLDNRRSNLRIVTNGQNQQNRSGPQKNNKSSGIRGVTWCKQRGKWIAQMGLNGKNINLGGYDDLEVAAKVVAEARKKHMPYSNEIAK
ncbi:HNH endonuclease [Aneurinibacillus aneurinilyticus]|jgi:hypothetical protein|uniref:HNH endonuclease n=1 Tax=Aneurinibacillus aneurinilyticus TaxID=1391 RepID=UPI00366F1C78